MEKGTEVNALKKMREIAFLEGYAQAEVDAMNAIGEAIENIADESFPDRNVRISAMVHLRSAVRGAFERKKKKLREKRNRDED